MTSVNLNKKPIVNLCKGQVIHLTKDGTSATKELTKVYFGASWDPIVKEKIVSKPNFFGKLKNLIFGDNVEVERTKEYVDLDASIIVYNDALKRIDTVYFGNLRSSDYAISHSGDDRTGESGRDDRDNETISIDLSRVTKRAKYLVAILNSYTHQKFNKIPRIGLRIYTGEANEPDEILASYDQFNTPNFNDKEAIILGYFFREDDSWKFSAVGKMTDEKSILAMSNGSIKDLLRSL